MKNPILPLTKSYPWKEKVRQLAVGQYIDLPFSIKQVEGLQRSMRLTDINFSLSGKTLNGKSGVRVWRTA